MRAPLSAHKTHWGLDPQVVFLNHGSFGACPRAVLQHQSELRARLEAEPVRFLARELEPLLDEARAALGGFVGAAAEDLAFVSNATTGVNTVLRNLRFQPGDELLTTDNEYNASRNALDAAAAEQGVKVVVARLPWPVTSPESVVDAVMARVTPRTRLLLVDHITSQTALVMPLAELVRKLREQDPDNEKLAGLIEYDMTKMAHALRYYRWLDRFIDVLESGEIFDLVPREEA